MPEWFPCQPFPVDCCLLRLLVLLAWGPLGFRAGPLIWSCFTSSGLKFGEVCLQLLGVAFIGLFELV